MIAPVKSRLAPFEYSEITIDGVLRGVGHAVEEPPCETSEAQNGKTHIVETKGAVDVMCRRCRKDARPSGSRLGSGMPKTQTATLLRRLRRAPSRNGGQGRGNLVFCGEVQYRAVS